MIFEYPVLGVREVHDGDTYRLDLDVGFEHAAYPWLRLKDYSCPELKQPKGVDAKVFAEYELKDALRTRGIWVRTFKRVGYEDMSKSFARYLAEIYLGPILSPPDKTDLLGELLVAAGLADRGAHEG